MRRITLLFCFISFAIISVRAKKIQQVPDALKRLEFQLQKSNALKCESVEPFENLKEFIDIAAPLITIASALLALFAETSKEEEVIVKGKVYKTKSLTRWAWVAMVGILIGGSLSIWGVLNIKKIDQLNSCSITKEKTQLADEKAIQDYTYKAKTDTIINTGNQLSKRLLLALRITKKVDTLTLKNLQLSALSLDKQKDALTKEDSIISQTDVVLNPLAPFRVNIGFTFRLEKNANATGTAFGLIQDVCRDFESKYVIRDQDGTPDFKKQAFSAPTPGMRFTSDEIFGGNAWLDTSSLAPYLKILSDCQLEIKVLDKTGKQIIFNAVSKSNVRDVHITSLGYNTTHDEYTIFFEFKNFNYTRNREYDLISWKYLRTHNSIASFKMSGLPPSANFEYLSFTFSSDHSVPGGANIKARRYRHNYNAPNSIDALFLIN